MKHASTLYLCIALMTLALPAQAAIEVSFIEDAPKDRFVIVNTSACTLADLQIMIDLGPSTGGLYFDTTDAGAGVQVFQPFEVTMGDIKLLQQNGEREHGVGDGQTALTVQIAQLAPGARAEFTIDVDDTVVNSRMGQTRVATEEIVGARIALYRAARPSLEGYFNAAGKAVTPPLECTAGKEG